MGAREKGVEWAAVRPGFELWLCHPWVPLAVAAPLGASASLSVKSGEEKRVPTLGCSQSVEEPQ